MYEQMKKIWTANTDCKKVSLTDKSGVYLIMSMTTYKRYIGASRNLAERYCRHNRRARIGYSGSLYSDMRKYGISNFIFTILEFCNPDELADKEKKWIKKFNSNNSEYGYNSTPGGDHLTMQSDATKAKKRQAVSAARERKEAARIERNREYHEELEKRRAEAKVEMQRRLEWIEQENLKHPPVVTYVC